VLRNHWYASTTVPGPQSPASAASWSPTLALPDTTGSGAGLSVPGATLAVGRESRRALWWFFRVPVTLTVIVWPLSATASV